MADQHHHGHEHDGHQHHHGHENDQGLRGALRYLRFAPRMWRSDINDAVVAEIAPLPGEQVVDIGAGMGAGTVGAAATGATVIAVEPTPFMRRVLQLRRLLQRNRSRIVVRHGTAESLPVADGSATAIWAVNTMHHWSDPETAAAEIVRICRPGGRVLLVDENFTDPSHPDFDSWGDSDGGDSDGDDGDGHHHHGFTMVEAERMGTLLTEAGMVDVEAGNRVMAGVPVISVTARR
jgi:SAM-dependent methyltransferase